MDNKKFDYESDMKNYYKSDDVAEKYFKAYNTKENWRVRLVAKRERNVVESLLHKVPHGTILDIPTGTGKLAPVFAKSESSVLACDISENMLKIAKNEYNQVGKKDVRFQVHDAENLSGLNETFDVAVCLRLLHRVPTDAKRRILNELGSVAEYVIVSTGIESSWHKWRREIRESLLGGDERQHCYESLEDTREIFTEGFEIIKSGSVLPLLSQEHVFLLKPTNE